MMPNELAARPTYVVEEFTEAEQAILRRYFTNLDRPVFCLINLPEVVKGALYARYSRTAKSTRRLFLDEFVNREEIAVPALRAQQFGPGRNVPSWDPLVAWKEDPSIAFEAIAESMKSGSSDSIFSMQHAEELYNRVFRDYGDDSVTQLGGVHVVFEQASNVVINLIEWGRLAAYLEQSTRFIDFSLPLPDGRFRYFLPPEVMAGPHADEYLAGMDELFGLYRQMFGHAETYFYGLLPKELLEQRLREQGRLKPNEKMSDGVYGQTIRAKAFDTIRTMLPFGIVSNVGFFGSAQAAANMLYRLLSSDLLEANVIGQMALEELRHPDAAAAFFTQIDDPEKGVPWQQYFRDTRANTKALVSKLEGEMKPHQRGDLVPVQYPAVNEVQLVSPVSALLSNNEARVAAAILHKQNFMGWDLAQCLFHTQHAMKPEVRRELILTYAGPRGSLDSPDGNRRWKPGRAFEHAHYLFRLVTDIGAMRDWKRHRLGSFDWEDPTPYRGWIQSPFIADMGQGELYQKAMELSAHLYELLKDDHPEAAQYTVCLGYRMVMTMEMNARALMFMIELRSSNQGHPNYRIPAQQMHTLIREVDSVIGEAMSYADYNEYDTERAAALHRSEQKAASAPKT